MILKRLTRKDPSCWSAWPALQASIETAARAFRQQSIQLVLDKVLGAFVSQDHPNVPAELQDRAAVWYVVDAAGVIRGHLVALMDAWDSEPVVFVNQLWARGVPRDLQTMADAELTAYARTMGATQILMYTRRVPPAIVRLWHTLSYWERRHGFTPYRMLAHRRVEP